MAAVIVTADLRDFFRESLTDVRRRQRLSVAEATEKYLLDLLIEGPTAEEPLALLLSGAQEAAGAERMARLKRLGDAALYTAGFFADTLHDSPVGPQYYVSMGRGAYGTLAEARAAAGLRPVFAELAARFMQLLEVLSELYERTMLQGAEGTLKLYERYLRTGSERLRWQLGAVAAHPSRQ